MPDHDIRFAKKLIEAAQFVASDGAHAIDAQQTVLCLSLLSCEVSLKAFLENAGVPAQEIAWHSNRVPALLDAVCRCEVKEELLPGRSIWVSASRVRAIAVVAESGTSTVGTLFALEVPHPARNANAIRNSEWVAKAPANVMLLAAKKIEWWVTSHLGKIRYEEKSEDLRSGGSESGISSLRAASNAYHEARNVLSLRGAAPRLTPRTYVTRFCKAYGGGIQIGAALEFDAGEQAERAQDFWIGYLLVDDRGEKCGEVCAGYVAFGSDVRLHAEIEIDDEVVDSEASILERNTWKSTGKKELRALLIRIVERATRRLNLRGRTPVEA